MARILELVLYIGDYLQTRKKWLWDCGIIYGLVVAVLIILACGLDTWSWGSLGTLAGNTEARGDRGGSHSRTR